MPESKSADKPKSSSKSAQWKLPEAEWKWGEEEPISVDYSEYIPEYEWKNPVSVDYIPKPKTAKPKSAPKKKNYRKALAGAALAAAVAGPAMYYRAPQGGAPTTLYEQHPYFPYDVAPGEAVWK